MMTFDTSQHAGINFRKVYRRANEILASSPAVSSFPFRAKELVREQSDIAFCSFDKARKCHVDIKQFGSESAVLMELDGAYIIFFNQDEVKYRIRFSIMHEYGHYELGHKMNLKREDPLYGVQEIEANCFAAQILMPEQLLRECAQRGKTLTQDFIIRSFDVSPEAAQKRINTLSKTVYEWRSRTENCYDDIILKRYAEYLNMIAPKPIQSSYYFEDDYKRELERNDWIDTRSRWR